MKKQMLMMIALFVATGALVVLAQGDPNAEGAPAPEPAAEKQASFHSRMAGEWTWSSEASTGPDTDPMTSEGTSSGRAIGDYWVVIDVLGKMGESEFHGVMTLGQDPDGKISATWIASMDPRMWEYTGSLDETGNALTLAAEGPDMADPTRMRDYKDVWTFVDDDTMTMESFAKDDEGKWQPYMKMDIKRKK